MTYDLPEELQVTVDGPVRILTLNRPEALNAVNPPMHDALVRVWAMLDKDPDARAVVITGAGRAFSAGGDMDWIERNATDDAERHATLREARELVNATLSCRLPVIGALNGPAVGLGASIIMLCDVVFMADDAYLADPHVAVGLVAGDGGAATWPLATSLLLAKEYILTGDRIPADEAQRMGLVNHAVPAGEVLAQATALAHRLASLPPFAVQQTKLALNIPLVRAVNEVLPYVLAAQSESFTTPEVRATVERFRTRQLIEAPQRSITPATFHSPSPPTPR